MYTFIFSIILAAQPYPVFAFLSDHESLEDCRKAIEEFDGDAEVKSNAGCMVLVKPENFKEGTGV